MHCRRWHEKSGVHSTKLEAKATVTTATYGDHGWVITIDSLLAGYNVTEWENQSMECK